LVRAVRRADRSFGYNRGMGAAPLRTTDRNEFRRWLAGRRAGEERERQEARRHPMPAEQAIGSAVALAELVESLHGWPVPEDEVSRRENEGVRHTWLEIRRRSGRP